MRKYEIRLIEFAVRANAVDMPQSGNTADVSLSVAETKALIAELTAKVTQAETLSQLNGAK